MVPSRTIWNKLYKYICDPLFNVNVLTPLSMAAVIQLFYNDLTRSHESGARLSKQFMRQFVSSWWIL